MATARVPSPFAVCPCPVRPSPARRMPRADSGKAAGDRTAKVIAHAIAQLLEARGMSSALRKLAVRRNPPSCDGGHRQGAGSLRG
jgi:hypothetical protein